MGTESGIPAKPPTPFAQTNRCFSKIFKANEKSSSFSTEYLNTLLVIGVLKAQYTPPYTTGRPIQIYPHTHTMAGRPIQIYPPTHTPQAGRSIQMYPHTHTPRPRSPHCRHGRVGDGGGEAAAARPRSLPAAPYTSILSAPGAAAR